MCALIRPDGVEELKCGKPRLKLLFVINNGGRQTEGTTVDPVGLRWPDAWTYPRFGLTERASCVELDKSCISQRVPRNPRIGCEVGRRYAGLFFG